MGDLEDGPAAHSHRRTKGGTLFECLILFQSCIRATFSFGLHRSLGYLRAAYAALTERYEVVFLIAQGFRLAVMRRSLVTMKLLPLPIQRQIADQTL